MIELTVPSSLKKSSLDTGLVKSKGEWKMQVDSIFLTADIPLKEITSNCTVGVQIKSWKIKRTFVGILVKFNSGL